MQLVDQTAVRSHSFQGEFSFFSGFLEKTGLEALFRNLPDEVETPQDLSALHHWFVELLCRYRNTEAFAQALASAAGFVPRPGNPVFSIPLVATASHRLSLLGIHPAKPIPLHDHPGAWSVQMILSGRAFIRHCDLGPQTTGNSTLAYLKTASEREFGVDEISTVTPGARNIHSLSATAGNAVLLSIQRPSCDEARQSWFFPMDPSLRDESLLLCHRVSKKARVDTVE